MYTHCRGGGASVAKTLDLLKAVLQSSFNMEVKRLCDDYQHIFSQAASNVRDNTGDSVPDATIRLLVCKMIEEVCVVCVCVCVCVWACVMASLYTGTARLHTGKVGIPLWKG